MAIEIVFKNLAIVDLPLAPLKLGYHAERLLPGLKRLDAESIGTRKWGGLSLYQLSSDLERLNISISPHGLRLGLRDLMDCGAIGLKPDPRFEPLI
jgi:hypothetical protein